MSSGPFKVSNDTTNDVWKTRFNDLVENQHMVSFIIQGVLLLCTAGVIVILCRRGKEERHSFVFLQLTLYFLNCLFGDLYIAMYFNDDLSESVFRETSESVCNIFFILCHWVFVYQYLKVALLMPIYFEIEAQLAQYTAKSPKEEGQSGNNSVTYPSISRSEIHSTQNDSRVNNSSELPALSKSYNHAEISVDYSQRKSQHHSGIFQPNLTEIRKRMIERANQMKRKLQFINLAFIAFTVVITVIIQLQTYSQDFDILTVIPLIFLAVCMVWSMLRIQTIVKLLNSDDFYSNEKLVYFHIFIFIAFTLVVTVEYSITFVVGMVVDARGKTTDQDYKWYFIKEILECIKSIVVNIIGYTMLYMILRYSKSHHRDDFREACDQCHNKNFLLVFNNDAKGIDAVKKKQQMDIMRKEAQKRVERNKDAAKRILDDLTVQVFMSLLVQDKQNQNHESGSFGTPRSSNLQEDGSTVHSSLVQYEEIDDNF